MTEELSMHHSGDTWIFSVKNLERKFDQKLIKLAMRHVAYFYMKIKYCFIDDNIAHLI
jgi:hypothetical protein